MTGEDFVLGSGEKPSTTSAFRRPAEAAPGPRDTDRLSSSTTTVIPATEQERWDCRPTDADAVDDVPSPAPRSSESLGRTGSGERAAALRSFAAVVDAHVGELLPLRWLCRHLRRRLEGRPAVRTSAAVLLRITGTAERQQIPVAGGLDVTFHEPIGVVGAITRGNSRCPSPPGIRPALAAGNAVVLKTRRMGLH